MPWRHEDKTALAMDRVTSRPLSSLGHVTPCDMSWSLVWSLLDRPVCSRCIALTYGMSKVDMESVVPEVGVTWTPTTSIAPDDPAFGTRWTNLETTTDQPQLARQAIVIQPKGQFIAGGTTSLVERLPSGDVIKTPWAGDAREDDCRREIAIEARIYQQLGEHPRLVKLRHWDAEAYTLTLEYMPNGTLEQYTKTHFGEISMAQRLRWVSQAAEALHLLHSAGIIHCDVGPHNLLLDADLSLKITDFSGSSLHGSRAMVCPGQRYTLPDPDWKPGRPPTVEEDLFALGSTIYFIMTGKAPFEDLPDDVVEKKYLDGVFPDLKGVPCGEIIALCWQRKVLSALAILKLVDKTCQ
ncbi:hypothetical protein ACRALDRAFT_1070619 [Sodiomyces alcalophilus JCM 7366]|uniref:uncharacterized protein n=1 Tax=Sodiomyces alcalophilus JCM 7366 TaxID=591952 RepID=UPI0039B3801A